MDLTIASSDDRPRGLFKQRFVLLKGGIFVCGEPNWIGISYYFMNEEEVSKIRFERDAAMKFHACFGFP